MKKIHQIKINDTDITLKFGFGFLALLGQKWGCDGPIAIINKFAGAVQGFADRLAEYNVSDTSSAEALMQSLPENTNIDIPFATLEAIADIVVTAAEAQKDTPVPDRDDVAEWMMENPEEMQEIISLFMQSMPIQRETEKKPAGTTTSPEPMQNP